VYVAENDCHKRVSRLACASLLMPMGSVLSMPRCHDQDTTP
jgi:hypothetical protein